MIPIKKMAVSTCIYRCKGNFLFKILVIGILILATFISLFHSLTKDQKQELIRVMTGNQFVNQQREELLMAVLVMSDPKSNYARRIIRKTWASDVPEGFVVRFVIGTAKLTDSELAAVLEEDFDHGDLILLPRLEDAYNKLSFKLLEMLVWANENLNVRYLMKVDEDSFVQPNLLADELLKMPSKRLYWGYFNGRGPVLKEGKFAELEYNMCDRYTPYALGGGYVLSADLVTFVAQNHALLKVYKNEDVSLGSWLSPLDIHREHDERFDTEYHSRGCKDSYLVTHKHSLKQIQLYHRTVQYTGKLCIDEYVDYVSYMYNWNVPPSRCCEV